MAHVCAFKVLDFIGFKDTENVFLIVSSDYITSFFMCRLCKEELEKFTKVKSAVKTLQSGIRCWLIERRLVKHMAASRIQASFRCSNPKYPKMYSKPCVNKISKCKLKGMSQNSRYSKPNRRLKKF